MEFMKVYKVVNINGRVFPGIFIKEVQEPSANYPYWKVILKNGNLILATGQVDVEFEFIKKTEKELKKEEK